MSVFTTLTAAVAATDTSLSVVANTEMPTASHFIAVNGERMRVTGGFGTATLTVERDLPDQPEIVYYDDWDRVEDDSWGPDWKDSTGPAGRVHAVANGYATIEDSNGGPPAEARAPRLSQIEGPQSVEVATFFTLDKVADVTDIEIDARPREHDNGTRDRYEARVRIQTDNDMTIRLFSRVNGVDNSVGALVTHAALFLPDTWYGLRVQALGINPTTLNAKVWKEDDGEPGAWDVTGTDSNAVMQAAGYPALAFEAPAGATNLPLTIGFRPFSFLRVALGRTHANGSRVVVLEDYPLPAFAVTGEGAPNTEPFDGVAYIDSTAKQPDLYWRAGANWHRRGFVSVMKWGVD